MSFAQTQDTIRYASRRSQGGPQLALTCHIGAEVGTADPDSLEEFLVERYLLFVQRNDGVLTGQVYHCPYPLQQARCENVNDELVADTGLQVTANPDLVHYSPGVEVEIFPLTSTG